MKNEKDNQVNLPLQTCLSEGHDYDNAGEGYYKLKAKNQEDKDTTRVYRMIYCTKCGHNVEILIKDINPYPTSKAKKQKAAQNIT